MKEEKEWNATLTNCLRTSFQNRGTRLIRPIQSGMSWPVESTEYTPSTPFQTSDSSIPMITMTTMPNINMEPPLEC